MYAGSFPDALAYKIYNCVEWETEWEQVSAPQNVAAAVSVRIPLVGLLTCLVAATR